MRFLKVIRLVMAFALGFLLVAIVFGNNVCPAELVVKSALVVCIVLACRWLEKKSRGTTP